MYMSLLICVIFNILLLVHVIHVSAKQINTFLFITQLSLTFLLNINMNSYILLQMAALFFLLSLYLKQGIDSVYVMVGSFARANWTCKESESSENNKI